MPIYCWINKLSGKKVEVLRSFDEYNDPPTLEEAGEEGEWERIIEGKRMVTKSPGFGKKGEW